MGLVGVGLGLTSTENGLEVTEILQDGPVDRTGKVRIGDILKKVDGNLCGNTVKSVRHLLTGPAGSSVTLTFIRHDILGVPDAVSICVKRGSPQSQPSGSLKQPHTRHEQEDLSPFASFGLSFFNFGGSEQPEREETESDAMTTWQQGHDWWLGGDEQSPSAEYAPDCSPYGFDSPTGDEDKNVNTFSHKNVNISRLHGPRLHGSGESLLSGDIEHSMGDDEDEVRKKPSVKYEDEFDVPSRQDQPDYSNDLSSYNFVKNAMEQELRILRAERKQDNSRIIFLLTERDELKGKICTIEARLRQEEDKAMQIEKDVRRKATAETEFLFQKVEDAYLAIISSRQSPAKDPDFPPADNTSERLSLLVQAIVKEFQSCDERERTVERDLQAAKEEIESLSAKISLLQLQKDEDHRLMLTVREEKESSRSELAKVRKDLDMALQELLSAYQDAEKYKKQSSSVEEQSHQQAEEFESLKQSYNTMLLMQRIKDEEIHQLRDEMRSLRSATEKSIEMSAKEKLQVSPPLSPPALASLLHQ